MASDHTSSLTHLAELIRTTVPQMHPAGVPFVAGSAATAALLYRAGPRAGMLGVLATAACAAFFREPVRVPPLSPGVVVAPADGRVVGIASAPPPAELGIGPQRRPRCSVFLSVLDVHVQRIPVDGQIVRREYRPGAFVSAGRGSASQANERSSLLLRTPDGHELAVVQIAGLVARRIVCSVVPGDRVAVGQTYGLIRFGSRVDVYLPPGSEIAVREGQRAVGGETVVSRLASVGRAG